MIIITKTPERVKEMAQELKNKLDFSGVKDLTVKSSCGSSLITYKNLDSINRIRIVSFCENSRSLKDNIVLYDGKISDYTMEECEIMEHIIYYGTSIQESRLLYPYSDIDKILFGILYKREE